jgi:hypothetical protein
MQTNQRCCCHTRRQLHLLHLPLLLLLLPL